MFVINTIDDNKFSLNGVSFLRRYMSTVLNDTITIKNAYTSEVLVSGNYADFTVNGLTFGSASLVQNSLVNVLYSSIYSSIYTLMSFKNKIINGNFVINQRGYISGTATSIAGQYTLDRWRIISSGGYITFANNVDDNGKTVNIPNNVSLQQFIESKEIETGRYTLSWKGTATGYVNGSLVANGSSISITYGNDVSIVFTNGTLSHVQFEMNYLSTAFDFRPYDIELSLCRRYFERVAVPYGKVFMEASFNSYSGISFFYHEKRALPTVSFFQPFDAYTVSSGSYVSNAKTVSVVSNTTGVVGITYSANINLLWLAFTSSIVDVSAEL